MALIDRATALGAAEWRYPLAFGLASIPVTLAVDWVRAAGITVTPLLIAGVLVGYLFDDDSVPTSRVGFRTGVVAGLPHVVGTVQQIQQLSLAQYGRTIAGLIGTFSVMLIIAVACVAAVAGVLAAAVGACLASIVDARRTKQTES